MTSSQVGTRILIFAKAPEPGLAKTRLIPALGAGGAAVLAARMIRRTLATARSAQIGPIELWCAPDVSHALFALCQRDFEVSLHVQSEGDLGERMSHAFKDALSRAERAILIGTDIPQLQAEDLLHADHFLKANHDAALGPTEDGGYYLMGLRQWRPEVFADITWSTQTVMVETRARIERLQWSLQEVATRWDVDIPQDLARIARERSCASLLQQISVGEPMDFMRASNDTRAS